MILFIIFIAAIVLLIGGVITYKILYKQGSKINSDYWDQVNKYRTYHKPIDKDYHEPEEPKKNLLYLLYKYNADDDYDFFMIAGIIIFILFIIVMICRETEHSSYNLSYDHKTKVETYNNIISAIESDYNQELVDEVIEWNTEYLRIERVSNHKYWNWFFHKPFSIYDGTSLIELPEGSYKLEE